MTSNQGGGTHPGDPWSPDWEPAGVEETPEEEWPYDESLTLSDAEIEIAGLDDEDEVATEPEATESESETEEADELEVTEAEEARVAEELAAREAEELAARESEELAAREAEELAAREAEEAAAREAEELAAREAEEARVAEELAAREAEELAAREAEEARVAEELAAREAEEAAAREAEELAAREAEEARVAEELAAREAEELAAREAEEAAAREAEELAAREAEELAAREAEEARVAEELAAREAEEARVAEEAAAAGDGELRAVADIENGAEAEALSDEVMSLPMEEVALEDLQAEPEWLEAVEEMTLDDIAEAGEAAESEPTIAAVPTDRADEPPDEVEMPTEVIDSIASDAGDESEDMAAMVIEDATFEVVDLDDADLRADTAEHLFEALDFEGEDGEDLIAHDEITAEVPVVAEEPASPAEVAESEDELPIDFEVPAEYGFVASHVDETRAALAAFMVPAAVEPDAAEQEVAEEEATKADDGSQVEAIDEAPDEAPDEAAAALEGDQLQMPTATGPSLSMADEAVPEPAVAEPLSPEEELIARLSGDLSLPDFETFVQDDFARDFAPEPTQEHRGLAEAISTAEAPEQSALAATMPGVDHGHVGFQGFDEDLHFDDPDAIGAEEPVSAAGEDAEEAYGSDLTLRVASGVILVSLLAATLWAGGIVFLVFITVVAMAGQIEFYTALRTGGYRPMVLFGLLGGLGALVGTYVQGSDVVRHGPVAIAAALGLTVVATFAWYGSQETPPSNPWRNGLATMLGVAWIPALLALVFPMAEAPRSERLQIILVLLIAVAAFDVGSYFVGRALGSRKLSPVLSPNKTVEGLVGGIIATVIVALVAAALVDVFDVGSALAVAAGVIIASPFGDLAESLMKRSLGIKDMGQLIPGHGGVLDRIDSYLFAVPIAYLVLRWTGLL